jgi:hypothetical protein
MISYDIPYFLISSLIETLHRLHLFRWKYPRHPRLGRRQARHLPGGFPRGTGRDQRRDSVDLSDKKILWMEEILQHQTDG